MNTEHEHLGQCGVFCAQTIQKVHTGGSLDARGPVAKDAPRANGPATAAASANPAVSAAVAGGHASVGRSGSFGGGSGLPTSSTHATIPWQKVADFSNHRLRFLTATAEQNAEFNQVHYTAPPHTHFVAPLSRRD